MESKKINQLATEMAPASSDLTIIGDPITGVSKKITWLQVSSLIGTAANLQQVTDNGATTTNPIAIGGLTITGLATGVLKSDSGVISSVPFGGANGVATLGGDGKVPSSQLPSYVDDVIEVANFAALPVTGATGVLYITLDNNKIYRWTGSTYVEIADSSAVWGAITGTLSNQTDLQNALNAKLSSVGLTMPTAFTVSNSPLTGTGGTIAVTGAGTGAQYIKGDGTLATFPTTIDQAKKLITEVYNSTGATLTKGTVVYINGGQGNLPTITKANASADNTSAQTYGVVQADITNNNNGFVVVIGSLNDIDTSAYTAGTQLYLSGTTAGAWTSTKPSAPIHLVYVGIVVRSHPTQGVVEVRIQNGYELEELHDVSITSVANNQGIFYNSTTNLWENKSIATVLGYTPQAQLTLTTTGSSGAATLVGATLNIPNYGSALSGYVPYTGATANLDLGVYGITSGGISSNGIAVSQSGAISAPTGATTINGSSNGIRINPSTSSSNTFSFPTSATNTYTFPNATGTIALTSDIPSLSGYIQGSGTTNYVPKFTASGTIGNSLIYDTGSRIAIGGTSATYGVLTVQSDSGQFCIQSNTTPGKQLQIGYDHVSNNSYLSSLNQGVAFTPLALQPNGGNVLVGTATDNGARFQVNGSSTFSSTIGIINSSTTYGAVFYISNTSNSKQWNFTTVGSGVSGRSGNLEINNNIADIFAITQSGNVGIGTTAPSDRFNVVVSTNGNNTRFDGPTSGLIFQTNATTTDIISYGGTTPAYRNLNFSASASTNMTITTGGAVCIGTTAAVGAGLLNVKQNATVFNLVSIQNDASIGNFIYFMNSGGTAAGNIANSAGGVLYLTSSDYRLKQDFKDYNGLDLISKIKTYDYQLKCDNSRMYGVKAHELQEVIPYAVNGEKDAKQMQSVDYSKIVPILVKAIQELKAELDELKNK
jgi:hypothetical protein